MPCKKCALNFKKRHFEENLKAGYFKLIASVVWLNVFQLNLAHLFSGPFLLSRVSPQGFS